MQCAQPTDVLTRPDAHKSSSQLWANSTGYITITSIGKQVVTVNIIRCSGTARPALLNDSSSIATRKLYRVRRAVSLGCSFREVK